MVILALETVTRDGSLALSVDGQIVVTTGDGHRTHGERLPEEITRWLARQGRSLREIDAFAIVSGPGSFTGLRVGAAAIQGLALAGGRRVIPVPTLEAIAAAWFDRAPAEPALVVACLDGQRGDVFVAAYDGTSAADVEDAPVVIAAKVTRPDELAEEIATIQPGLPIVIVGTGARRYAEVFTRRLPDARIEDVPVPLAAAAVRLAADRVDAAVAPHALRPIYLRRPDAELARARARAQSGAPPVAEEPAFVIEPAKSPEDLGAVEALQRRSFTNAWGAEAIRWELENTDVARLYVVREPAGRLIAYCACWMIFDELHINSLAVDDDWRRRGIARRLLDRVMRAAVAAGARGATLEVRQSNQPARCLYEGLGFVVEAVRRDYYQEPREDALVLWHRHLRDSFPSGG